MASPCPVGMVSASRASKMLRSSPSIRFRYVVWMGGLIRAFRTSARVCEARVSPSSGPAHRLGRLGLSHRHRSATRAPDSPLAIAFEAIPVPAGQHPPTTAAGCARRSPEDARDDGAGVAAKSPRSARRGPASQPETGLSEPSRGPLQGAFPVHCGASNPCAILPRRPRRALSARAVNRIRNEGNRTSAETCASTR